MIKKLLPIATLMLLLASCTSAIDNVENLRLRAGADSNLPVFYATIEGSDDATTKVFADDQMRVLWNADDRISLFNKTTGNQQFQFQGEDGDNAGSFAYDSGSQSGATLDHIYSVYPYSDGTTISNDGVLSVTLPAKQTYKENSFGIGANTMVSVTDNTKLLFRNVGGYLSFKFYGEGVSIKSITLKGNNGEKLAGKASITMNVGGTPTATMQNDATETITLTCEKPVVLGATADEYTEFWLVVPPTSFTKGFTVTVTDAVGGTFEVVTNKTQTITRNRLNRMSPIQVVPDHTGIDFEALERSILIEFYQAMDGDHWKNNENWCSDRPLDEWYGINALEGRLYRMELQNNGLNGSIPDSFSCLTELKNLCLWENTGIISHFDPIFSLPKLETLHLGLDVTWCLLDYDAYKDRLLTIPPEIGNLHSLNTLEYNGVTGTIPPELFELENLETLGLFCVDNGKSFPEGLGKLKKLQSLCLTSFPYRNYPYAHPITGPIPDDLYDCTQLYSLVIIDTQISGSLSPKISNLPLNQLQLEYNNLSGPLPAELTLLPIAQTYWDVPILLDNNHFSGKIPAEFKNWKPWNLFWDYIIRGNDLDISDAIPEVPDFEVKTITGDTYSSSSAKQNKLTAYFQWATWCGHSAIIAPTVAELYDKYKDKGFEVLGYSAEDEATIIPYVQERGWEWPIFSNEPSWGSNTLGVQLYPYYETPIVTLFNEKGQLVTSFVGSDKTDSLYDFVAAWFGDTPEEYESTDYSADGTVHLLQEASSGNGINVVLMGDAFSDRLIADGTYQVVMNQAYNALFSEEPYASYCHLFNVYSVDVVSKNETYKGTTALSTWYGQGTAVGGNDEKVFEYARKALTDDEIDDALIIVMMNRDYYAGTCYMYGPLIGDYGRGPSIAYFPACKNTETFNGLVSHEAGGHGFAKLADEYAYEYMGAIPASEVTAQQEIAAYGWWKNVDFTNNPSQVKWAHFISDNRYANENIGCYEGAFTYWTGAWRPTDNSIMRYNTGGFNAPSREAIWYRIHKLAYGADWQYDYEDFVTYDAVNRAAAASYQAPRPDYVTRQLPKPTPPVVVGHSWREAVKEK